MTIGPPFSLNIAALWVLGIESAIPTDVLPDGGQVVPEGFEGHKLLFIDGPRLLSEDLVSEGKWIINQLVVQ